MNAAFGWHLFEIATTLCFIRGEPYFSCARDAVVAGYRERRALSDEHLRMLPLFLAVRAATYLGWVHTRKVEPAATELTPALIEKDHDHGQPRLYLHRGLSKKAPSLLMIR